MTDNNKDNNKGTVLPFNRVEKEAPVKSDAQLIYDTYVGTLDFAVDQYNSAQENDAPSAQLSKALELMAAIIGSVPNDETKQMLIDDLKESFPDDNMLLRQLKKVEDKLMNKISEEGPNPPD